MVLLHLFRCSVNLNSKKGHLKWLSSQKESQGVPLSEMAPCRFFPHELVRVESAIFRAGCAGVEFAHIVDEHAPEQRTELVWCVLRAITHSAIAQRPGTRSQEQLWTVAGVAGRHVASGVSSRSEMLPHGPSGCSNKIRP